MFKFFYILAFITQLPNLDREAFDLGLIIFIAKRRKGKTGSMNNSIINC